MVDIQYLTLDDVHFKVARTENFTAIGLWTGEENYTPIFKAEARFPDRACSAIAQAYIVGRQHGENDGIIKCQTSIREALGFNAGSVPEAH